MMMFDLILFFLLLFSGFKGQGVNVQMICDSDLMIRQVSCSSGAAAHDAATFRLVTTHNF